MKNRLYYKIFAIGIIVLLGGVSVSSAISIDNKPNIHNNKTEKECECEEVSDSDLIKLEGYLNRIRLFSNLVSILSKFNPELTDKCNDLLEDLRASTELYKTSKLNFNQNERPICDIFVYIGISLFVVIAFIIVCASSIPEGTLGYNLLMLILAIPFFSIYGLIEFGMYLYVDVFKCV
jgi:hypothetical protein